MGGPGEDLREDLRGGSNEPLLGNDEPPPPQSADAYGASENGDFDASEISEDMAEIEADIGPQMTAPEPVVQAPVNSFEDVVELARVRRDAMLKIHLEEHVSLVRFDAAQGMIELFLLQGAPKEIGNHLRERLNLWTGRRWMVALASKMGAQPLGIVLRERAAAELEQLKQHPAVEEVFRTFPDAKVVSVRAMPGSKKDDAASG